MIEGAIRTGGVKGLSGELPGHVHYGTEGPPGGHYIPEVNQTGEKTAVITFTASKPDMPAVVPVEIELPVGPRGEKGADGNVAFDDLTEAQKEMLRGPAGPAGERGEVGPAGPAGEKGETGDTGKTGPAGPQGERGATGPTGLQGSPGQPGRDGIDGVDGVTPHIGSNGNWFIGNTDTGKPSRGADGQAGQPGKDGAAGQPGKDGQDYVLTPADKEEIAELAAELVDVPDSGGSTVSSEWVLVADVTTEGDDLREIKIDKDSDGNSFEFREIVAFFNGTTLKKDIFFSVTSSDSNRPNVKQDNGTMPVVFYANELFLMCGDNVNFARLAQKYEHHNEKISQVRITSKWWASEFFTSGTTLKLYGRK